MSTFDFTIKELLPWVQQPDVFVEKVNGWVLVGPPPPDAKDQWAFRTGSVQTVQDIETGTVMLIEDNYEVRVLTKRQPGPFQDTILIGRAETNDVVIPDGSISKLHVRVRFSTGTLADANSSNGTTYDEKPLQPDEVVALKDGSYLIMGSRHFYLMSAEKLCRLLRSSSMGMPTA